MKSICILTLAASLAASTAYSGNVDEPILETPPELVIAETAASSAEPGDFILPLIIVAFLVAGLVNDPSSGGGGGMLFSDARVKSDATPVGVANNGLTIYQYRYTGNSAVFEGVMAQDVLLHTPEAVQTNPVNGIMRVNYDLLGIAPRIID